jgi:hypothetical protein
LDLDDTDEMSRKKICGNDDNLEAELDDLEIDMEGWDVPTGRASRTTRSSGRQGQSERKGRRQTSSDREDLDTDDIDNEPVQPRWRKGEPVPSVKLSARVVPITTQVKATAHKWVYDAECVASLHYRREMVGAGVKM